MGWTLIDAVHHLILDDLLQRFNIMRLDDTQKHQLNKVWHRLNARLDSIEGLTRCKSNYTICSFSTGNIGLLANMAKYAGLPWDCILSAEVFKKYKPDSVPCLGFASISKETEKNSTNAK
ncbi:MAG: hypothetical protein H7240_08325 [Glaciimonas sp.]|nr:hypothetical protein [Glaciimonas sp.]